MKIIPIKNTFIFKFKETINNKGQFEKNTTETGIILQSSFDDSAKESRWVVVTEIGPNCVDVRVNDVVLLPALRWTAGAKFNNETIWKSDDLQAVVKQDRHTKELVALRDTIVFKPIKDEETTTSFGIVLVKDPHSNSPRGIVVAVGPDCVDAKIGEVVFYDDANFFDTFVHEGEHLAFIKEDKILALG